MPRFRRCTPRARGWPSAAASPLALPVCMVAICACREFKSESSVYQKRSACQTCGEQLCNTHVLTMATMHTGRASGLAAADGQPRARGVHRRNRGTENSHPARTRHACGHWANPQPRCTLKLTAMRRDPRPRRRHVQRDPCRGLHRAPALRPASSKRRRDQRRAHMPLSEPSVKSTLPYPK